MDTTQLSWKTRMSSGFQKYKRVWNLLKRPTMEEFKTVSKVSAIGLLVVGLFGFLISIAIKFLLK